MAPGSKAYVASTLQISQTILKARKRLRIKQEGLGRLVGCSRSYISKLEKGNILPSPMLAIKLEKELKMKKGSLVRLIADIKAREATFKKLAIQIARSGKARFLPDGDGHRSVTKK